MSEQIRMSDVRPGDTITVRLQAFPDSSTLTVLGIGAGSTESTVLITFTDHSSVEFAKDDIATRE